MSEFVDSGLTWGEFAELKNALIAEDRKIGGDGFDETIILTSNGTGATVAGLLLRAIDLVPTKWLPDGYERVVQQTVAHLMSEAVEVVADWVVALQYGGLGTAQMGAAALVARASDPVYYRQDGGDFLNPLLCIHLGDSKWGEILQHKLGSGPEVGAPGVFWAYRK